VPRVPLVPRRLKASGVRLDAVVPSETASGNNDEVCLYILPCLLQ